MPYPANLFFRLRAWLKYHFRAADQHALHAPFVYEFYEEVMRHPYTFNVYSDLEAERERLLSDSRVLSFKDSGAGNQSGRRIISEIASTSLMPHFKAAFLLKLVHWLKPGQILELGTCLGLTTAYLAQGSGTVYTFEASESMAEEARSLWKRLQMEDIVLKEGNLDETLPEFLSQQSGWNLAIMDANHRYEPTMNYYRMLKNSCSDGACIVLDDIYWSEEMASAWQEIRNDPAVQVSIDLFHLGVVFFRRESSKQHFILKWQAGA